MIVIPPETVPYYYGDITRENAELILWDRGCLDGMYLLRSSQNRDTNYVLSLCFKNKVLHYRIKKGTDASFFIYGLPTDKFIGPVELVQNVKALACQPLIPCNKTLDAFMPGINFGVTDEEIENAIRARAQEWGVQESELQTLIKNKSGDFYNLVVNSLHTSQPWFHGKITREEAEERLAENNHKDGKFLVRERDNSSYTLCLSFNGQVKHYKIDVLPPSGEVGIQDGQRFQSLILLINHYSVFSDGLWCTLQEVCFTPGWKVSNLGCNLKNLNRAVPNIAPSMSVSTQPPAQPAFPLNRPIFSSWPPPLMQDINIENAMKPVPLRPAPPPPPPPKPKKETAPGRKNSGGEVLTDQANESNHQVNNGNLSPTSPGVDLNQNHFKPINGENNNNHDTVNNNNNNNDSISNSKLDKNVDKKLFKSTSASEKLNEKMNLPAVSVELESEGVMVTNSKPNLIRPVPAPRKISQHTLQVADKKASSSYSSPKPQPDKSVIKVDTSELNDHQNKENKESGIELTFDDNSVGKIGRALKTLGQNVLQSLRPRMPLTLNSAVSSSVSPVMYPIVPSSSFFLPSPSSCDSCSSIANNKIVENSEISAPVSVPVPAPTPVPVPVPVPRKTLASPTSPPPVMSPPFMNFVINELKSKHLSATESSESAGSPVSEQKPLIAPPVPAASSSSLGEVMPFSVVPSVSPCERAVCEVNNFSDLPNMPINISCDTKSSVIKPDKPENKILLEQDESTEISEVDPVYEEIDPDYEGVDDDEDEEDSDLSFASANEYSSMDTVNSIVNESVQENPWDGAAETQVEDKITESDDSCKLVRKPTLTIEESEHMYKALRKFQKSLTTIDRKKIVLQDVLGNGQFGDVIKAIFKSGTIEIPFAAKMLRDSLANGKSEIMREARIMMGLDHPHIVRLIGICEGHPFLLVMEIAPLGSLNHYLKAHTDIPMKDVLLLVYQVALGMEYLESQQFVHRDLAARNVLLVNESFAKISDFGMSRTLGLHSDYYKVEPNGKLPLKWYAPECIYYFKFSCKSDVWSFGITLWEAVSYGERPYHGMVGREILAMFANNRRLPRPEKCPEAVHDIMWKCWQLKPEDRPHFYQLVVELKQFVDN